MRRRRAQRLAHARRRPRTRAPRNANRRRAANAPSERHAFDSRPSPSMPEQKWPDVLWIVRHGQSAGNVAREAAEEAGVPLIDIATRDMDTPLSKLGEQQAAALGRWFGALPSSKLPTVVLSSPYVRAVETTRLLLDAADGDTRALPIQRDERLREKEFGALARLT